MALTVWILVAVVGLGVQVWLLGSAQSDEIYRRVIGADGATKIMTLAHRRAAVLRGLALLIDLQIGIAALVAPHVLMVWFVPALLLAEFTLGLNGALDLIDRYRLRRIDPPRWPHEPGNGSLSD